MTPRLWFHVLLFGCIVPCLTFPIATLVALFYRSTAKTEGDRYWTRRLVGLAAIDAAVLAAMFMVMGAPKPEKPVKSLASSHVIIGIQLDPAFHDVGSRVTGIEPKGPAEKADLRAGDVIHSIDGKPVTDNASLTASLSEAHAGTAVSIAFTRGETQLTASVTPINESELQGPGLFEPSKEATACFKMESVPRRLVPWGLIFGIVAVLGVFAFRRGESKGIWLTLGALSAGMLVNTVLGIASCEALGGQTTGGGIIAQWGLSGTLGLAAWFGMRQVPPPVAPENPLGLGWALGRALLYLLAFEFRAAVCIMAITRLSAAPLTNPFQEMIPSMASQSSLGLMFMAVAAVVVGPIAEELAFRGLLLPSLSRWLPSWAALAISSAFFASLHWYYGVGMGTIFVMGMTLGWVRQATGKVGASMLLHMGINTMAFSLMLLRH